MIELSKHIVKHELIEKFLDNRKVANLFETLCEELTLKLKYLPQEDREKIQKASERLYKAK